MEEAIIKWSKVSGFAVVWKDGNSLDEKPESFILAELPAKEYKKAKFNLQIAYPIFNTKKEAELFRDGIKDWVTIPVEINVPVFRQIIK